MQRVSLAPVPHRHIGLCSGRGLRIQLNLGRFIETGAAAVKDQSHQATADDNRKEDAPTPAWRRCRPRPIRDGRQTRLRRGSKAEQ
jgi:hypothetical protein